MKKILLLLCGLFIMVGEAYASPMYLSVTGTIYQITGDPIGTYTTGDTLDFTVMYDYEDQAYFYMSSNLRTVNTVDIMGYSYNYYAEYIGGDALSLDLSHSYSLPQLNNYHYGSDSHKNYPFNLQAILTSPDIYSYLEIERSITWNSNSGGFDSFEWEIGDTVNIKTSNNRENLYLRGWVSALSDKNPFNPVPEPATMFLFGLGLLGLAGVNRKQRS